MENSNIGDILFDEENSENIILYGENGEEIVLTEADFAYNEEYGTYDVVAQFEQAPAYVTVRVMGNPYHDGLEDVENYVGNARKLLETTVYGP